MRALVDRTPAAREWIGAVEAGERTGHAPAHVDAEVAHALLRYVRTSVLSRSDASTSLGLALRLPLRRSPLPEIVAAALSTAVERRLSVYDACYVVVAEALEAPLLTADRRLAGASDRSVLIA